RQELLAIRTELECGNARRHRQSVAHNLAGSRIPEVGVAIVAGGKDKLAVGTEIRGGKAPGGLGRIFPLDACQSIPDEHHFIIILSYGQSTMPIPAKLQASKGPLCEPIGERDRHSNSDTPCVHRILAIQAEDDNILAVRAEYSAPEITLAMDR